MTIEIFLSHLSGDEGSYQRHLNRKLFLSHLSGDEVSQ